jgi:DNA-binding CsgD family transcriptional regulator/tetratricopeptide (TPR) repeat protein
VKLLERERELAEIDAALTEVVAGRGRAVAIEAGAGLGKTRLLHEARQVCQGAGLVVLSARATELERDFTFASVRQLFEVHLAALPEAERGQVLEGASAAKGVLGLDQGGDESTDPFVVLHGLYWITAALADRAPLLIEIDDAHWADPSSLDYLYFLLPRLAELPVLLMIAARPGEPDLSDGLRRILDDPSLLHLDLAPLSDEATSALLSQELGREPEPAFAAVCREQSGGNPFLLGELTRVLAEREIEPHAAQVELVRELAPERVGRSVALRIQRLSASAGVLARALAILGDDSDLRLVAALAELDPEAARQIADELRRSFILDGGASLRFIHPLIRNAVYADVPAGERAQAHARAANLLRERGASPERIAGQLLAGASKGDRATTETLVEVGERALATGSPRSAIAYLTRALEEPPPPELRPKILGSLLSASLRAADQAAFTAIEPEVFAAMEREPSLRSAWSIQLTMLLAMGGRFEDAASMIGEAVEVALSEGQVECAFQLEAQLKTISLLGPSVPEVDLTRFADKIDPNSAAGRLAAAMEARSLVMDGTAEEAAAAAKRALADDAVIFTEEPELAAAVLCVLTLVISDEIDAARHAAKRALALAREEGGTPSLVRAWFLSAFVAWGSGDLISAEADMRQAIELARLAGIVPLVLLFTPGLIQILIERDELEAAEAELQATGMATGPVPVNVIFNALLLVRAHLRLRQGDLERGVEEYHLLEAQARKLGLEIGPALIISPEIARALVASGKRGQALALAGETTRYAVRWAAPSQVARASRTAAAVREGAEAVDVLEEAAASLGGSPVNLERARVLADLGAALRREGRRVEAREPLREAFQLARRCGAAGLAKRANAELQATGVKVRRYTPIGVESLTPSERRVAELAASGMTNRQIAQSLFVTVKTVEAHLSGAYDKLDIDSRRELPDALAEPPERET